MQSRVVELLKEDTSDWERRQAERLYQREHQKRKRQRKKVGLRSRQFAFTGLVVSSCKPVVAVCVCVETR